jgi:hypothetical protein
MTTGKDNPQYFERHVKKRILNSRLDNGGVDKRSRIKN